jgi:hypothetical protein
MAYIYTIFRDWPQKLFQEFINHFVSEESIPPFRASSKQSDCYLQLFHAYYMLMIGTIDERKERVTPGEYRTDRMKPRNRRLLPAKKINSSLGELLREYEARKRVDRSIILDFHVRFEQIFPFEDGNGRVGRLIMFKECLRYDVMPFILDDKSRTQYLAGIQDWASDRWTLTEVVQDAQNRFEAQVELQKLAASRGAMIPDMYGKDDE